MQGKKVAFPIFSKTRTLNTTIGNARYSLVSLGLADEAHNMSEEREVNGNGNYSSKGAHVG